MDLSSLLQQQLGHQIENGLMDQLTRQIGGAPKRETTVATSAILSSLMGALARNASTPQGADSLSGALDRDHDGSILDDLGSLLGGGAQSRPELSRTLNGAGILKHILGEQQQETVQEVSQTSGLSTDKVGSLMVTLAPIVLGMLGKTKRERNIDSGGLGGMLTDYVTRGQQGQAAPDLGLAGQLLDRDRDGSVIDDIASIGTKMLGGFFNRR